MPNRIISSVPDLIEVAQDITHELGHLEIWWRGQAKSHQLELVPSVYRNGRDHTFERNISARFTARARTRYANCPSDRDLAGWLFLMQHYGLPTRLLDWTESPLVAAFFAVRDEPESDAILWALNPYRLNESQSGESSLFPARHPLVDPVFRAVFSELPDEGMILGITPKEIDIRMLVQLSMFTVHGSSLPLEQLENAGAFLCRFTIPANVKRALFEELHSAGVRLPNLFPDLEHLAIYLSDPSFRIVSQ